MSDGGGGGGGGRSIKGTLPETVNESLESIFSSGVFAMVDIFRGIAGAGILAIIALERAPLIDLGTLSPGKAFNVPTGLLPNKAAGGGGKGH
jgi:hypothetical protein